MSKSARARLGPVINHVPLAELTVYHITEAELDALEQGSSESLFLNLAIAFLSTATSFLCSLLTTDITSDRVFYVFVIVTVACFIAGLTMGLFWWRFRRNTTSVVDTIRARRVVEDAFQDGSVEA